MAFVAVVAADLAEAPTSGSVPRLLDLGSGGGLPGLVIASCLPSVSVVLLEGSSRRASWLRQAVDELGVEAEVLEARAEEAARQPGRRGSFRFVTARSFGAPPVVAECAAPFLAEGGLLVVSEPPVAVTLREERWPELGLRQLGLSPATARERDHATLAEMRLVSPCDERYPRRVGIPAKRPLW